MQKTASAFLGEGRGLGVCSWQKNDFGFAKKLRVSVRFWFSKINRGFAFFCSVFCTVCCLMCMTLEMYFRAELVQLTVNRSDSELEVQRYGMKKNTLTVDPIILQDEL